MKITYKHITLSDGDILTISSIDNSKNDKTVITVPLHADRIAIQDRFYSLSNNELTVNSSEIKDGEVEIRIFSGSRTIIAEPFIKDGDRITKSAPTRDDYDRLLTLLAFTCEKISALGNELSDIKARIEPKELFKFN